MASVNGEYFDNTLFSLGKVRKSRNMTQGELAMAVGCSRETISNIEAGKYNCSLDLALKIAHVLEVNLYELLTACCYSYEYYVKVKCESHRNGYAEGYSYATNEYSGYNRC